MTTLTYSQLEGLWINAGGDPKVAPIMAAIALAESSGRSDAVNRTDNGGKQTSWGLWQISDGTHNWGYGGDPFDPLNNAIQAVTKYDDGGFRPWGTYTSGAYKRYMQSNVAPDRSSVPSSTGGGSGGSNTNLLTPGGVGIDPAASFMSKIPVVGPLFQVGTDITSLSQSLPGAIENVATAVGVVATAAEGVTTFFQWLSVKGGFIRLGMGIVGIVLLFFGIHMIATAR